jgi:hypothetical protein
MIRTHSPGGNSDRVALVPAYWRRLSSGRFLIRSPFLFALITLSMVAGFAFQAAAELDDVVGAKVANNRTSMKSQAKVDGYSDQTDALLAEYKTIVQQLDALKIYNRQVETLIASQTEEAASLEQQIDGVELVGRQITPLMLEMISGIESFVELDLPFLLEERRMRVSALHEIMERADVTDAERYRRIMEAYQIETDFGRSIEAYRADLELGGVTRSVDFLRFGRISLLYQTQDGSETGVWDQDAEQWVVLPNDYRTPVRQGLRIARKQVAPDMLQLPIPAAEDAE